MARMHRHDLPLLAVVDENQRVEKLERGVVRWRAGDRRALPQRRAAHDRRIAVDIDRHAAGLQTRELQTTRTDLLKRFPPRLPRAVVKRPDERVVEQRLESLRIAGERGLMEG